MLTTIGAYMAIDSILRLRAKLMPANQAQTQTRTQVKQE
jgi:hypothetical protein